MRVFEPTDENIQQAATAIRSGELVVMPTETVYGLACLALDSKSVLKAFEVKKRPAENPLIVHCDSVEMAQILVVNWPDEADLLVRTFWPGPLTLVLPKASHVPSVTTGGLDTVAVREPAHQVALKLIGLVGEPLAAPSANVFTELSPTRATDLATEILKATWGVLDGGPCSVGLESTVVSLVGEPTVLRLGQVSVTELEGVLGSKVGVSAGGRERVQSPGQHSKHYSPHATIQLVEKAEAGVSALVFGSSDNPLCYQMPENPSDYARELYSALHNFDRAGIERVQIELPPSTPEWAAIHDRLKRMIG